MFLESYRASLVAQMLKHLPTMRETRVWSLGPLEKEMATHSSTLAWKIPWTEEPCGLQSMGWLRVRHHWATSRHFSKNKCKPPKLAVFSSLTLNASHPISHWLTLFIVLEHFITTLMSEPLSLIRALDGHGHVINLSFILRWNYIFLALEKQL